MKRFLDTICARLLVLAVVLCFALSFGIKHYRQKALTVGRELQQLQDSVAVQNRTAAAELARLTLERNAAQAQLDQLYQQQEETDVLAVQEIARLSNELEQRPVRVRIVASSTTCGAGSGGTTGDQATAANSGAADAAQTYGLLPAANSARLAGVIQEIETINVAYASCRSQWLHP